jgi:hypothetical protein
MKHHCRKDLDRGSYRVFSGPRVLLTDIVGNDSLTSPAPVSVSPHLYGDGPAALLYSAFTSAASGLSYGFFSVVDYNSLIALCSYL